MLIKHDYYKYTGSSMQVVVDKFIEENGSESYERFRKYFKKYFADLEYPGIMVDDLNVSYSVTTIDKLNTECDILIDHVNYYKEPEF